METHNQFESSAPHKENFYLGFVAGTIIGGVISYLSHNQKQSQLKHDLLQQAKHWSKQLPDIIDELAKHDNNLHGIQKQIHEMQEVVTSNPDDPSLQVPAPETKTSTIKKISNTAKSAQKFFSKAGKMLRGK